MALDQGALDAVSNNIIQSSGQNAVSNQQNVNVISQTALAQAVNSMDAGGEADLVVRILAALSSGQIGTKTANTTPPPTV